MAISPKKILVVEDSKLLHHMYDLELDHFKKAGAEVFHAMNGKEAFEHLNVHPDTDIVILDVNMPVMTGLEFLQKRTKENLHTDVPIILVTVKGSKDDVVAGLQAGINGYLKKPIVAKDLVNKIIAVMNEMEQG